MIMNARQHIYVKIMQFAAVLCQCQCVRAEGVGQKGLAEGPRAVGNRLNLASQSKCWRARHSCRCRFLQKDNCRIRTQKPKEQGGARIASCWAICKPKCVLKFMTSASQPVRRRGVHKLQLCYLCGLLTEKCGDKPSRSSKTGRMLILRDLICRTCQEMSLIPVASTFFTAN